VRMTGLEIIAAAKARRQAAGLRIDWIIPAKGQFAECDFTAYAKDEAQKQAWIASAARDGWELMPCAS
jgi:hypothetical protein